jgi:hypothetical protein
MEFIGKTIAFAGKLLLFALLSVIFLPSFLVVTYLQESWSTMLSELFSL